MRGYQQDRGRRLGFPLWTRLLCAAAFCLLATGALAQAGVWIPLGVPGDGTIKSIAVDHSTNPPTVYVFVDGWSIYKWSDGTWATMRPGLYNTEGTVLTLALDDTTNPGTLYAADGYKVYRWDYDTWTALREEPGAGFVLV